MQKTKHKKWSREEVVRLIELLIERKAPIVSHPKFRQLLDRDQNLYVNQITREANGNLAYRSVDIDFANLSDEQIWEIIDSSEYSEVIEENAAIAIMKMAEKLDIAK